MEVLEYCTPDEVKLLLAEIKNPKHRAQVLLMHDAGLRVSEMLNLQWVDFDFRKKVIRVKSLKKRGEDKPRFVPMSARVYDALAQLVEKKGKVEGYVFANAQGKPQGRSAVNNMLKEIQHSRPEFSNLHPHKLRHTFATNLRASGAELEDIKDLLGHEKLDTSMIYTHAKPDALRALIEASQPKKTFWEKLNDRFLKSQPKKVNLVTTDPNLLIGRDNEVKQIGRFLSQGVSVLLVGPVGIGKSHIINNLKFAKPVIEIDDCKDFKKSVANILLFLFQGDKEAFAKMLYSKTDKGYLETKVSKESLINLCKLLKDCCQKDEYILKIGDLDSLTPSVVKALEILKDHFTIIATARSVKMTNASFLWNFEKIDIKPLLRIESLRLMHRLTEDLEIENIEFARNKVYDTSEGNPRVIVELCERMRKEPVITGVVVDEICNNYLGKQVKELDMSIFLLLIFGGLALLKYIGQETNQESLRFIGGCVMILLLFARYFFNSVRRKAF